MQTRGKLCVAALAALLFDLGTQAAYADKLCLKITVNPKTAKVTTQKSIAAACPKGFTELADTSSFAGPAGPAGPAGATGPTGATGATGPQGPSNFSLLTSGTTVRGVIGGWGHPDSLAYYTQSLPAPTSTAIKSADMIIAHTARLLAYCNSTYGNISGCLSVDELAKNEALCTGSFDNPTAPSGKVCIYIDVLYAGYDLEAQLVAAVANTAEGSPFGFSMQWFTEATFSSKVKASWAYTAP